MNLSRVRTKPAPADLLVAAAIAALAVLCGLQLWQPQGQTDGPLTAVVTIDGREADRFPISQGEPFEVRTYTSNGYTLVVSPAGDDPLLSAPDGLRVSESDCPNQDCVRGGVISQSGQSIVCLPARIVIEIQGGSGDGVDVILG